LTFPEIRRMRGHTQTIYELEMQKTRRVRFLSFLQGTTLNLLRQSILFTLLWLIFRDILTPGELIAMQFISTAIFMPLQDIGNIIVQYREAEASIQLFDNLMKKPIEQRPADPVPIGSLEEVVFEQVVFRHKSAAYNAIDEIS